MSICSSATSFYSIVQSHSHHLHTLVDIT